MLYLHADRTAAEVCRTVGIGRRTLWGSSAVNRGHEHQRSIRRWSVHDGRLPFTETFQTSPTHTARFAGRHKTGRPAAPLSPAPTQTHAWPAQSVAEGPRPGRGPAPP